MPPSNIVASQWTGCTCSSASAREAHADEHGLEAVATRPLCDAHALLGAGIVVDQQQQPFLALVLDQLAVGQPAAERDLVELRLVMHPRRRRAGGEREYG